MQLPILLIVAFLASWGLACSRRAETVSLVPGAIYPRALTSGEPYRFRLRAEAGSLLHLGIDQRGVDVVVLLRDPAGHLLFEADSAPGTTGAESVLAVTPIAGEYLLVVESFARGKAGAFTLKVRELRPARPDDRLRAAAAAALARAERRRSSHRFEAAAAAYREALPPLTALGDPKRLAEAEWRLGQSLGGTGALSEAAAILKQAGSRFRGLADPVGEARVLNDLGTTERRLGETGPALAAHQRALGLYRAADNLSGTATSHNDLGLVFESHGDLDRAIDEYEEALALWRGLGARSAEAATLENLGSLYSLVGHDEEALDLLGEALGRLSGERDPSKRMSILVALGWAEYLAGRPERALDRYQEALALAERSGNRMAQVGLWDRRGSALRALRRYGEAGESYRRALAGCRSAGSPLAEGSTLANLGWLDLETGGLPRARKRLARAVELLVRSGDPNGEIYARLGLSRAERGLGAFGAAQEQAETAVRGVEAMRAALRGSVARGQFLATRFDAYEEMVALLLDLDRREPGKGHAQEALEWAERARARNLLEEMESGAVGKKTPGGEGERRRQALLAEIPALEERRRALAAEDPQDPHLRGLEAGLRARRLELDRIEPPNRRPVPPPLTAAGFQALADEGTLFVVYLLAEPASFAWTVDRHSVVAHVLPGRERIERLAHQVAAGLSENAATASGETVRAALREMSRALLAPLGPRLAGRRCLAILADGALHRVPFSVLPIPVGRSVGEPLLAEHDIAMLPSATVLLWQRQHLAGRPLAPEPLAVLADPVFSLADERIGKAKKMQMGTAGSGGRAVWAPAPGTFERLPYTAEEARAIAGFVPRGRAFVALGPAANRELVLGGALRRYRILHFATHGLLDPVLPERSGIVLSRFDERGRPLSGFLAAPSVAALDLPAELAVLSGCQTGLGRDVRGEGQVGLPQAFFRAGTRRVLVSLWNVRDQTTAQLMARFYGQYLGKGLPAASALRAAQLSLQSEERWKSPYFWAGFCLQGDWR